MAKSKRMTNREKALRAATKKSLQEQGIIPPDKPRLNRKKYIEETRAAWESRPESYVWEVYLEQALFLMMGMTERRSLQISKEAVGAAKVIRLALRQREFLKTLQKEKRTTYSVAEQYEYIKDILEE